MKTILRVDTRKRRAADDIAGERAREEILSRGGDGAAGKPRAAGCVIRGSKAFPDKMGRKIADSLQYGSICRFVRPPFIKRLENLADFLKGSYGWELSAKGLIGNAWDAIKAERDFNLRAGVSEEFRPIPEFVADEPLPPKNSVFGASMDEMRRMREGCAPSEEEF